VLSIATWNVLADMHVLPERYSGVAPDLLEPSRRRASVVTIVGVLAEQVDVMALQEVDAALVDALQQSGLHVEHQPRPHVTEGVALVSRHPQREVATGVSSDGRRGWLGATVAGCAVVSAHIDWVDPAGGSPRALRQAEDLASWCEQLGGRPIVVAGDINAPWDGDVGRVLGQHGFVPLGTGWATAAIDGVARELDVVAACGCSGTSSTWHALAPPGTPQLLPSAAIPSDHVPIVATIRGW